LFIIVSNNFAKITPVKNAETIKALLARGRHDAPAIGAPGKTWLTYGELRALAERTAAQLRDIGIDRNDRVGIVLPNGPEMAACFLAVASSATAAPLNQAYLAAEFDFYLTDLNARALVILAGLESPAREVAEARGIPIVDLVPESGPAGAFTLRPATRSDKVSANSSEAGADDIALVLHTSGTTARPKIVPLSQRNVTASAHHIARSLALTEDDVCLNIMPLFHIHGLIAAVLSTIGAGGAVCCAPGLNAFRFFNWFSECRPTWYTAVPTMHQTLLELAPRFREAIANGRLRFIRSSSASLPPQVMTALEETFGVPVLEAYGMTEAAHQMASNPLPPRPRYPGSVGIAAGPDVAVMDETGRLLPAGTIGEVVIRGPNVTRGYENNPSANASAFADGWFRTGDQGVLDSAGYLRLTGRLKEIINRAGEKVAPLEVDTVLMDHPAVKSVVTFAMPDRLMGEEVAAAVVLRDGETVDEQTLCRFAATRLAPFKVPRKIVFLAELPKGTTGKLQRIGLAEKLGLS
jgi:acyl-CoA synthetase (AMP-forming)/AMP-acid ligase II